MKIITVIILALFISSSLGTAGEIVAVVNDEAVTEKDINDYLNVISLQLSAQYKGEELEKKINEVKPDILQRLIEDKLILQEAKRQSIQANELRVEERLKQFKNEFSSQDEFQNALSQQGITIADLKNKFQEQLLMFGLIDKEVKSKIVIRPGEITQYYQIHIQDFREPESRQVTSIFIDNEKRLEGVLAAINRGEDFYELSKKYSEGSSFSGVVKRGQLRKEVEDAVFSLSSSEPSKPLKLDTGFYIFKLEKIIEAHTKGLLEAKEDIYDYLFQEKLKIKMIDWLDGLKSRSYIKIK